MGKGSKRRPCQVPKEQYDKNFEAVFGKKLLNVMSDEDQAKRFPFWTGPGYQGEYNCPHGCGHGNHRHGCCEFHCCTREDFPLKKKTGQGYENGVPREGGRCTICGRTVYSHKGRMPASCSSCASDF